MKKSIVITSIFGPTKAVKAFANLKDYHLYVVGDKKSPSQWSLNNTTFLSVEDQLKLPYTIVKKLPFNHYSRKMIGYLLALENGSDLIIDTDDDNIPKSDWKFPDFKGVYETTDEHMGFANIYQMFTDKFIWPRGFPLDLLKQENKIKGLNKSNIKVGVWQGLADEDPDVDAIYRLTNDEPCIFNSRNPIVLGKKTICPYNSQNTATIKELFPLLYLPTEVTFRFTDILRGLIAQPIMWLYDYHLGFLEANVIQERNPHDYMKDFVSELPMYLHCKDVISIVSDNIKVDNSLTDNLFNSYLALTRASICKEKELVCLEAWLKDINAFKTL